LFGLESSSGADDGFYKIVKDFKSQVWRTSLGVTIFELNYISTLDASLQ
jgi:hypothetical protein